MPDRGLGRRYTPDARDAGFPMRAVLDPLLAQFFPNGLPEGHRHYRQGEVLDQGNTGTCVGHSWRSWLNGAPMMTKSGPGPFDLYRAFIAEDEWVENDAELHLPNDKLQFGTSIRAGAKWLHKQGHIAAYVWTQRWEDVRAFSLAGLGTTVLGTTWTQGMFEPEVWRDSYGGRHYIVRPTGRSVGGHAYVQTGWTDHLRLNGTVYRACRCLTSWGEWGDPAAWGRFWLLAGRRDDPAVDNDLQRLLEDDGECCAAREQKVTPVV